MKTFASFLNVSSLFLGVTTISAWRFISFPSTNALPTTAPRSQSHHTSSSLRMTSPSYDLVVIGGGSAGLTAAKFASRTLKKRCLLIERERLGGDCTWTGCVPSKSLLASAKAAQLVRKQAVQSSMNWIQIQQRFRDIQQEIYEKDDSPQALAKFGIETLEGTATLLSAHSVRVESSNTNTVQIIEAKEGIIVCTGAKPKPAAERFPGLDTVPFVTYEEVWDLKELPKRLTVIGGGPIGCELAQALARLGSQVTMITSKLLPREEPEVSTILQTVFEEEGIRVVSDRLDSVSRNADGTHTAMTVGGEAIVGDLLLVAIGRTPHTRGLGLEKLGVQIGKEGGIVVNEKLETTCKGLYAAGDCTGDKQFTHYAGYQGAIAARNILLPLSDPGVLSDVPSCTFTSPEVASLGYSEEQARKEFGDSVVGISKRDLAEVDRALCDGQRHGILKVIYHNRNGKILGATIMAPAAGELISEIAVARSAGMTFDALAKVIHPYPSYAMALQLMAADVYYEKTTNLLWLYNFLKRIGL